MGVYLSGAQEPQGAHQSGEAVETLCAWCGAPIDRTAPYISPPSVQALCVHIGCAAELGTSLIADEREAALAMGGQEWGARALALVRFRLRNQEWE